MNEDWKRFVLPMIALLAVLIVFTGVSNLQYGTGFWNTFYPQFLATVFGVALTIIAAYLVWRYQLSVQQSRHRRQLLRNLEFELDENLKRLRDLKRQVHQPLNTNEICVSMLMRGFSVGGIDVKFLSTVAMGHITRPDNLLLSRDPDLDEDINWLLWRTTSYNDVLSNALNQLESDLASDRDLEQAVSQFRLCIQPGLNFFEGFPNGLEMRLSH